MIHSADDTVAIDDRKQSSAYIHYDKYQIGHLKLVQKTKNK